MDVSSVEKRVTVGDGRLDHIFWDLGSRVSDLGGLMGRSGREVRGSSRSAANHFLDLSSVVTSILLAKSRDVFHLVLGDASNLGSLAVDDF